MNDPLTSQRGTTELPQLESIALMPDEGRVMYKLTFTAPLSLDQCIQLLKETAGQHDEWAVTLRCGVPRVVITPSNREGNEAGYTCLAQLQDRYHPTAPKTGRGQIYVGVNGYEISFDVAGKTGQDDELLARLRQITNVTAASCLEGRTYVVTFTGELSFLLITQIEEWFAKESGVMLTLTQSLFGF